MTIVAVPEPSEIDAPTAADSATANVSFASNAVSPVTLIPTVLRLSPTAKLIVVGASAA